MVEGRPSADHISEALVDEIGEIVQLMHHLALAAHDYHDLICHQ